MKKENPFILGLTTGIGFMLTVISTCQGDTVWAVIFAILTTILFLKGVSE